MLKAFCTCKAGASGYCNHVLATMHQTAHFYKLECQTVPLRSIKTDNPQVWDKPTRGKKIKAGSVMDENVKVKLGEGWKAGQKCTLYEAREGVSNNNTLIDEVRDELQCENANYGFVSMASGDTEETNYVLTRAPICTLVPQRSVLSYQLSTTEANFDTSSIDTSLFCDNLCTSSCEISDVFPVFPLNPTDYQPNFQIHQSVVVSKDEAAELEQQCSSLTVKNGS